jgi:hypothetical protein
MRMVKQLRKALSIVSRRDANDTHKGASQSVGISETALGSRLLGSDSSGLEQPTRYRNAGGFDPCAGSTPHLLPE